MLNGKEKGLCCEPRCKNPKRKDRLRCFKCDCRRKRKKNPMRAAYRALKDHAAARQIHFRLSFTVFRAFALQTDYLNRTGLGGHCLTVDRIVNTRGYVRGNIQALTRAKNAEKRFRHDAIRMKFGYKWKDK